MAKIKKGTYRFNDVLTQLTTTHPETGYNEVSLQFTFTADLGIEGYENTLFTCSTIYQEPRSEEEIDSNGVGSISYTTVASTPDLTPLGFTYPFGRYIWSPANGWELNGAQYITIPKDTDVSDEFGVWFTANTKEQKQISGKWTFKDVLTPPNKGESFVENVNFECIASVSHPEYGDLTVHGYFYKMDIGRGWSNDTDPFTGITWYWSSVEPDLGFEGEYIWVCEEGGWMTDTYGEGIKTIDFGDTPQWVSVDYFDWHINNTERSGIRNLAIMGQLIDKANAVTGKADATLADGVSSLCEGYGQGGGAEFNIAFGDTEPTDTTKLWVKSAEPEAVSITSAMVLGNEEIDFGISSLPKATYAMGTAVVGTKVYLFGGSGSKDISIFDTETNTITTLSTKLPHVSESIVAEPVGTKIYLFGGYGYPTYYNDISIFDTETNGVTTLSTRLPKKVDLMASAAVGKNIYLFGGESEGTKLATINKFSTESNTITTLSVSLPVASDTISAEAVGTKIYLFGGRDASGKLSTINVYDTEKNSITTLSTTLPVATYRMASAAVGTNIYLFGGLNSGYSHAIYRFNATDETITTLSETSLSVASDRRTASAVGTNIYLFGGYCSNGSMADIDMFVTHIMLAENNCLVEASAKENFFDLLPNVKLGVKDVYLGNSEGYAEKVDAALYKNGAWTEI